MRKKRMLAELDTSLILGEGFHVTRSKHEFNPHVIQPEVLTTLKVQSEWLLHEGHRISKAAWADAVEEDTEVFDTAVQLDTSLPLSTPMSTTFKLLEGLLRPVDLQPHAKRPRYIPNMALMAAARRKRATIQQQLGTGLKAVAIRKGIETQSRASICTFVGPGATAWTGSRAPGPIYYTMNGFMLNLDLSVALLSAVMVSAKTKSCCAGSPPIYLRIPISKQTESQRAIKKECRKIGRSMASSRYRRRQAEAGKAKNRLRMAETRAGMTDEEKATTNRKRKEAAAASYLRQVILNADLWYPYQRNTYRVGEGAGVSANPRIYL
ncbi:MAG: hypothetical protein NXY57DRAFT_1044198 [Lentinula lateritia]|nr:MAG: hypothetical protein NXY57DRAFT_1044198 [Lentinula lateritia]